MNDLKLILEQLGYKLQNDGSHYYRAKPIYRDSGNATSLRISKKNGRFIDYSANIKGSLQELVQITLNLKNYKDAKDWLKNQSFCVNFTSGLKNPIIENTEKYYDIALLKKLVAIHDYWISRKVNPELLIKFQGGVCISGSMANRYVFPIFNVQGKINGFAGRDLTNKNNPKWKLVGKKSNFIFPVQNVECIKERREIILVESIGDCLSLETAGICNAIVLFGVNLSDFQLSRIVGFNPSKIIVAFNNDKDNGEIGLKAANQTYEKLCKYFDKQNIEIRLPKNNNDFGEMNPEEIKEWYSH